MSKLMPLGITLLCVVQLTGCAQAPSKGASPKPAPVTDMTGADAPRSDRGDRSVDDLTRASARDHASGAAPDATAEPGNPIASPPPFGGGDNALVIAGVQPDRGSLSAAVTAGPRSRATGELLQQAQAQAASGQPERAAATIERALKIEPRNALLWNRLAQFRSDTGSLDQAVECAYRSNSLAGSDSVLKARNWELLALLYERRGSTQRAQEARVEARRLRG